MRGFLRWHNLAHLGAGIWLGISPWLLGFFDVAPLATWNALLAGGAVIVLTTVDLDAPAPWELWMLALVGAWTALSPLLLGYGQVQAAAVVAILTGSAVLGLALAALLATPTGRNRPAGRHATPGRARRDKANR